MILFFCLRLLCLLSHNSLQLGNQLEVYIESLSEGIRGTELLLT